MPVCAGDRSLCRFAGLYCETCGRRKHIEEMTRQEFRAWDADPWGADREVAKIAAQNRRLGLAYIP